MIIFIYGQNTFSSQQKLQELKNKFIKDVDRGEESIKIVDGEKTTLKDFSQAVRSSSLFSQKKLIIIKNISANKDKTIFKKIRDYLKEIKSTDDKINKKNNILIFIDEHSGEKMGRNVLWQYLLKQPFVQNFPLLNNSQKYQWIQKRASELGAIMTSAQIAKIAGTFSGDLWQIDNELKKIIHYKKGKTKYNKTEELVNIDDKDLDNMSRGEVDENIFALTDAISSRNKKISFSLLEKEIEAGVAETYLLYMIIRQFKILLQLKQAMDDGLKPGQISSSLKLHPYVVQKGLRQVGGFSFEFLKTIFLSLVDLDKKLKTGQADFLVSMDLLISNL